MILPFSFKAVPQIIFGPGKLAELADRIANFGCHPLLVLGRRSFSTTGYYKTLQEIFDKRGMRVLTVHIGTEPSPARIDEIVANSLYSKIDFIIGVGGGSALDGAKAISAMLVEKGKISRFLEGVGTQPPSGKKLPFIAIPTTAGTGSEATSNAVLSSVGEQGFKNSLRHDNFVPNLALVDPALTLSCPKELSTACGMDCFTQLVEGYLSTKSTPLTDTLALEGIRAIQRSLPKICSEGDNLVVRTDLSYGALLSGIVLANSGLGTVHGFASALGALFDIPHGVVCGTLMAPVNRFTMERLQKSGAANPALSKYALLGEIFSDQQKKTAGWYQNYFIEELERLAFVLQIPKLSDYEISATDITKIIAKTNNKNNPAKLTVEELTKVLSCRID